MLADAGGVLPRRAMLGAIAAARASRPPERCTGSASGSAPLDVFIPSLLKPAAQQWRAALLAVRSGQPMPRLPSAGAATLDGRRRPARRRRWPSAASAASGCGSTLPTGSPATPTRSARQAARIRSTERWRPRVGLDEDASRQLMAEIGFARAGEAWRWRGQPAAAPEPSAAAGRTPSPRWRS